MRRDDSNIAKMPKYPKNKKGKQPLRPKRGLDRRWISCPDPDPPDDQGAIAHSVNPTDKTPVMAGGLVIREPNPCPSTPERLASSMVSPQEGALIVRLASGTDGMGAQTSRSRLSLTRLIRPTSPEHPIPSAHARVTVESVTDEEAGQSRPPRPSGLQTQYDLMRGASPESEQQDSSLGIPAAQSTAQNVPREETQFHSVLSHPPSENTSRFSWNSLSIEQVLCEHTSQAETRMQSAYEQSRVALDLISKSMDNVRGTFTEAKHTCDRFHDILSVSSRSCQSV